MESVNDLIAALKALPGIGNKSARRIAFHLLKKDDEELAGLGKLISGLKKNLYTCKDCGNISEQNPCAICSDPLRDRKTICIVEDVEAINAFEEAGVYNGIYHILSERIAPLYGQDITDSSIKSLLKHINKLKPDEVIIATSPKFEGDMTYYTLLDILKKAKIKNVTRIAYGIPVGGSIEFADKVTLHAAMESRVGCKS